MKKTNLLGRVLIFALICLVAVTAASAKGRKFGLFVGINEYQGDIHQLHGCVNDATKMRDLMIAKYGFKKADTTLLTDAEATREGILAKLKLYGQLAGNGDMFVFHYSGHGTLFPDKYSDDLDETKLIYMDYVNDQGRTEVMYPRDKYDSAIVPVDSAVNNTARPWGNLILDDELYGLLSAITQKGAHVVFVSDSCHSGTIAKAGNKNATYRMVPLARVFGAKTFDDIKFKKSAKRTTPKAVPFRPGYYVALTGARDDEFSLDLPDADVPMGLFTSTLIDALSKPTAGRMTYEQLVNQVSPVVSRESLKEENNQDPQLDSRFGNPNARIFWLPPAGGK